MKILRTLAIIATLAVAIVTGQSTSTLDVRAFGAKGDGKTLDSDAIDRAIAGAHNAGGGTVRLPAGTYLSTSIHLQSNVGLFIDHGATIVAAEVTVGPYDEPEANPLDMYQDSLFVLRSVRDFLLRNIPGIADTKRANVDKESL